MKKILVTGGAGFIGSHTCLLLLENGYEIHSIDSHINSYGKSLDLIKNIFNEDSTYSKKKLFTYKGDIRDYKFLENIFLNMKLKNENFSGVIHFAGLKSATESILHPLKYWDVNLNGTINLLKIMEKYECRNIVFSSSAMIYSKKNNSPLKETDSVNPINPYGSTKLAVENLLKEIFYSSKAKWKIANLRYFNPIGAHSSGIIGECPKEVSQNIFPRLIEVANGKLEILKIFGKNHPTYDGTAVRDYVHVMDIADGHLKAFEALIFNEPRIITINLGTNIGTSVLKLIKTFENTNNIKIKYEFSEKRIGEPSFLVSDISLANKLLNWSPKRDLKQMCLDGWNWSLKNPKGYKV